jgi:hypothetical protein
MAEDRDERGAAQQAGDQPQREENRYRSGGLPRGGPDSQRSALERLAADLLKKGFEAGRDTLRQTDEALKTVGESIFAREIAHHLTSQLGDIRDAMTKAVAGEIGRFLREADLASEVRRMLQGMTVEAKVQLRFPSRDQEGKKEPAEKAGADSPDDNEPGAA